MLRRLSLFVFLAMSCLVVSSAPVWGHPSVDALVAPVGTTPVETISVAAAPAPAKQAWHPAPGPAPVSWIVLAAAGATVFMVRRKTRRGLALAIVVIMAVFAFENGVHSVHHLDNHATGTTCAVASAAAHVA